MVIYHGKLLVYQRVAAGFIWIQVVSLQCQSWGSHQHFSCQPLSRPSRTRWTIPARHQCLIRTHQGWGWRASEGLLTYINLSVIVGTIIHEFWESLWKPIINRSWTYNPRQIWILQDIYQWFSMHFLFIFPKIGSPEISHHLGTCAGNPFRNPPGTRPFWTSPPRAIPPPWALAPFLVPLRTDPTRIMVYTNKNGVKTCGKINYWSKEPIFGSF